MPLPQFGPARRGEASRLVRVRRYDALQRRGARRAPVVNHHGSPRCVVGQLVGGDARRWARRRRDHPEPLVREHLPDRHPMLLERRPAALPRRSRPERARAPPGSVRVIHERPVGAHDSEVDESLELT